MTHARAGLPPAKRKRDPKGTRERLVRAALELFTSQGFHASTTPQIAARAGIAEGTIYRHFQSKEHLLNELYRAAVRMLTKAIAEAPRDVSCQQCLVHIASAWRTLADRHPPLIKLIFQRDITPQLDAKSRDAYRHFRRELETVLAAGKAGGEVRAGSVSIWTDVWLRLVALVLERTASGEWPLHHAAPPQVLDCAWQAIRTPEY